MGRDGIKADILINHGAIAPLTNGIPIYIIEMMNVCVTNCDTYKGPNYVSFNG